MADFGSLSSLVWDCRVRGGAKVACWPSRGLATFIALAASVAVNAVTAFLLATTGKVIRSDISTIEIIIEAPRVLFRCSGFVFRCVVRYGHCNNGRKGAAGGHRSFCSF